MQTRVSFATLLAAAIVVAGCVHYPQLEPAPNAQLAAGEKDTAVAELSGIRLLVDGSTWRGEPRDLESIVTPVRATLENRADWPLRIRYQEFALATPNLEARALPPFHIQRPGVAVASPYYANNDFYVAPPFAPFYPGLPPWAGSWDTYPSYYDDFYQWQPALPTRDMIRKALPEGVLAAGGQVSGFLYFQPLPRDTREVRFIADLIDANTKTRVGRITIPLVVKR